VNDREVAYDLDASTYRGQVGESVDAGQGGVARDIEAAADGRQRTAVGLVASEAGQARQGGVAEAGWGRGCVVVANRVVVAGAVIVTHDVVVVADAVVVPFGGAALSADRLGARGAWLRAATCQQQSHGEEPRELAGRGHGLRSGRG